MNMKKMIPILSVWGLMLAIGIIFNCIAMEFDYFQAWEVYLNRLGLTVVMCLVVYLLKRFLRGIYITKNWEVGIYLIVLIGLSFFVGGIIYDMFGFFTASLATILIIYLLTFDGIKKMMISKRSVIGATLVMMAGVIGVGFALGLKYAFVAAVVFMMAEVIAFYVFMPVEPGKWIGHMVVMGVIFAIAGVYIIFSDYSLGIRAYLGFNPEEVREFEIIKMYLSNVKLIGFTPDKYFPEDIRSSIACVYTHFLVSFGIIPTVIMIGMQIGAVVMMWRNTMRFRKMRRQYLSYIACSFLGLYILVSIVSSAVRIPLVEFGAPFLSSMGLDACVMAVALYCYLHYEEAKEQKVLAKKNGNVPEKGKKNNKYEFVLAETERLVIKEYSERYRENLEKLPDWDDEQCDAVLIPPIENVVVTLKDGTFIGWMCMHKGKNPPEIAITLMEEYQNKGYGTEAIKGFFMVCAKFFRAEKVAALIKKDNSRSIHVFEKLGGEYVGDSTVFDNRHLNHLSEYLSEETMEELRTGWRVYTFDLSE